MSPSIDLLANNGRVGGGEVMMVALAQSARRLGIDVRVVAPEEPVETLDLARSAGLEVVPIAARDRFGYLKGLATHRDRFTADLWWCNGLVPAVAMTGSRHRRVVHLHQAPSGLQRRVWPLAKHGVERVVVPSESMRTQVPGSTVLANWTEELALLDPVPGREDRPVRVGFIGRFSPIKGLDVLARAVTRLDSVLGRPIRLVVAGDARFVSAADSESVERALAHVSHVERLGWVPREDFFASIDVAVVPSVWAEPFGLVVAEAMAFGRPVVVSDAGALVEVVGPEHPWVARAGDEADTARVIGEVCDADDETLTLQRMRARQRWEREFSPTAGQARVARILAELGLVTEGPQRDSGQ